MNISIPEAVLLLSLDDEHGTQRLDTTARQAAVAAAGVAQLLLDGRLRISEIGEPGSKPDTFVDSDGTSDPRLDPIAKGVVGLKLNSALYSVIGSGAKTPSGLVEQRILDDYVDAGILERRDDRWLGITWRKRWERGESHGLEDALQARAEGVLDGADDPVVGAALAILHAADALQKIFPERDRKLLKTRGAELAEASWASEQVRRAIRRVQSSAAAAAAS